MKESDTPDYHFNFPLKDAEYDEIVYSWNNTERPYPKGKTICELFQQQVSLVPGNIALAYKGRHLTYAELNERSNQLARHLRSLYKLRTNRDMEGDTLVGLCLDRSVDIVVGILGVLKAGAAYVPIDPNYPQARIDYMVEDTGAELVLVQRRIHDRAIDLPTKKLVYIELHEEMYEKENGTDLPLRCIATDLAYVIYTSGTTGRPKGVMVEHGKFAQFVSNFNDYLPDAIEPKNRDVLSLTNYVFDIFGLEYGLPLITGGKVMLSSILNVTEEEIASCGIVQQTPSTLLQLITSFPDSLHKFICLTGGEMLSQTIAAKLTKSFSKVFNLYGPAETVIWSTAHEVTNADEPYIGKPLFNESVYVLDTHNRPVPIGVVGELHVGGACLARGYLNNIELTESRFILNPFLTGSNWGNEYARIYKTGDLVKWTVDGCLEYVGRNDDQVKIRGHRIELGEVNHVLSNIRGIRQCCVVVKERTTDMGITKLLVGYYATEENANQVSKDVILREMFVRLPEYMVPTALVKLDYFPLTNNGKLDKRALPDPEFRSDIFVPPVTEFEQKLVRILEEVLGLKQLSCDSNFFEFGGNSLLATMVLARARTVCKTEVSMELFLKHPSVRALAAAIESNIAVSGSSVFPAVERIARVENGVYDVSFPQRAIWVVNEISSYFLAYNFQYSIAFHGDLNIDILESAINELIGRHEILRTTFHTINCKPVQKVWDKYQFKIDVKDLRSLSEDKREQTLVSLRKTHCHHRFDVSELPLFKWSLFIITDNRFELVSVEHHFVHDGWSLYVLFNELGLIYSDLKRGREIGLSDMPIQMVDFASWQRRLLSTDFAFETVAYWRKKLENFTYLTLTYDFPEPAVKSYIGGTIDIIIEKDDYVKLNSFAKDQQSTFFVVLLSIFKVLLLKLTGVDDIAIGSSIANRRLEEFERLIGMCVNVVLLRTKISARSCFGDVVKLVQKTVHESQHYQDIPFSELVKELIPDREFNRNPFFGVAFNFHDSSVPHQIKWPEVDGQLTYLTNDSAKFDLALTVISPNTPNRYIAPPIVRFEYSADLYRPETIRQIAGMFMHLIRELPIDSKIAIADLSLMTASERLELIDRSRGRNCDYPNETIHDLFHKQALKTPGNVALIFRRQEMTYKELNERVNQLARRIRAEYRSRTNRSMEADTIVALLLERSLEMVIGILAVLKAGGAYVPIDPGYPQDRVDFIVEETAAELILVQRSGKALGIVLPEEKLLFVDLSEPFYQTEAKGSFQSNSKPTDLAYIIYTSGTTGKPKGVMIEHRGAVNLMIAQIAALEITASSTVLQFAPYAFDSSVWEIFSTLLSGARLVIPTRESIADGGLLLNCLERYSVTIFTIQPMYLNALGGASMPTVKTLATAGELCRKEDVLLYSKVKRFFNIYGPTEATVSATMHRYGDGDSPANMGKPLSNVMVYILDGGRNPVPPGVIGELYIGGPGVARGYLNRPDLTLERFISNPFANESDKSNGYTRLYRTGDLGRWLPDGNIEYVGRNDEQVKIRGYRIELGEIESTLTLVPGIRQNCVVAKERKSEAGTTKYIVGYYVKEIGSDLTEGLILDALSEALPEYMIPSVLVELVSLPLTTNGKLDKSALPNPEFNSSVDYVAPVSEGERELCRLWQEVLGLSRVGIIDDFFRIGGNSILAIQLCHRMSEECGYNVNAADLFKAKSISKLLLIAKTFQISESNITLSFD